MLCQPGRRDRSGSSSAWLSLCLPGEILPLTPGFSPATPEAGQGGSRRVPALPAPNTSSHLQQANHEDELFSPAASSPLTVNLHPPPQGTMEEQYLSKLHPVVDYGAGVFLLIVGEFIACSFAWSQGRGIQGFPVCAVVRQRSLEGNDSKCFPTGSPASCLGVGWQPGLISTLGSGIFCFNAEEWPARICFCGITSI